MPQFILAEPVTAAHPYYSLDDFARGYVEAMFFTNGDTGDERENLLNEWGVERLTRASVAAIARDCAAFLALPLPGSSKGKSVAGALAVLDSARGYDDAQAGNDLWFTRQRHGVGYWDRDQIPKRIGECLSEAAHEMGESEVYVQHGWIYVS